MGLLSHIADSSQKKQKAGLLAKAENAKKNDIHSFQEWASRNGFEHCGVFSQIHGMMVLNGIQAALSGILTYEFHIKEYPIYTRSLRYLSYCGLVGDIH